MIKILSKTITVPGLVIRRTTSRCTSSNQMTHFLEVQATKALDRSVFYCGAQPEGSQARQVPSSCRCSGGRCYSRPALLISKSIWMIIMLLFFVLIITAGTKICWYDGSSFSIMYYARYLHKYFLWQTLNSERLPLFFFFF